jgi:hypothetical protein
MDFETAKSLIGKYVELIVVSVPFGNRPQLEFKNEGFVHEVVFNGNKTEGLRLRYANNTQILPLNLIVRYRVYEPGEWKQ